jgi:hypothetical protein
MSERLLIMDRKEISAFLMGCKPDQMMAYKDYGEDGVAAVGPDGRKYVFAADYLEQAEPKMNASTATQHEAAERAAKPAQPAKRKAPAERAARKTAAPSSPRTTKQGSSGTKAKK